MAELDIAQLRQQVRRNLKLERTRASLGDENGVVDEPGRPGYVRVRVRTSTGLSEYKVVRERAVIDRTPGNAVLLGYDDDDELAVVNGDFSGQIAQGANPLLNNPANQDIYQWTSPSQVTTLYCYALTTANTPSASVAIRAWIYIRNNALQRFAGAQVDLSSFIPSAGTHRIAIVYVTYDNATEITVSTAQNTLDPLTLTDVQEALDQRAPGSYPVWAWTLTGGATSITENDKFLDLRGVVNVDAVDGVDTFPLNVAAPVLVPSGRQITVQSVTVSSVLQVDGELTIL